MQQMPMHHELLCCYQFTQTSPRKPLGLCCVRLYSQTQEKGQLEERQESDHQHAELITSRKIAHAHI